MPDLQHSANFETSPSARRVALGEVWIFTECHTAKFGSLPSATSPALSKVPLPVPSRPVRPSRFIFFCRINRLGGSNEPPDEHTPARARLTLGKDPNFTECGQLGTRRSLNLCRVPSIWHSAKFSTRPVRPSRSPVHLSVHPVSTFLLSAAWHTAKVCRVPEKRHSAKPASPVEERPCALRRVLHSANNLPSVFRPLPSVCDTRQSTRVR